MQRYPILFFGTVITTLVLAQVVPDDLRSWLAARTPEDFGLMWMVRLWLSLFLGSYFGVLIHELGHAAAGRAAGLRFHFLTVRRLWIGRVEGRLRIRGNPGFNPMGGLCASYVDDREVTRRGFAWYILAGPLASLALAAATLAPAILWPGKLASILMPLWVVGSLSTLYGIMSLVPRTTRGASGYASDGTALRTLFRNQESFSDSLDLLRIGGLALTGIRPRDWPKSALERTGSHPDAVQSFSFLRILVLSDEEEHDEALALHRAFLEEHAPLDPPADSLHAQTHSTLLFRAGAPAEEIREWYDKAGNLPLDECHLALNEATVLIAEGNAEGAMRLLEQIPDLRRRARFAVDGSFEENVADLAARAQTMLTG